MKAKLSIDLSLPNTDLFKSPVLRDVKSMQAEIGLALLFRCLNSYDSQGNQAERRAFEASFALIYLIS